MKSDDETPRCMKCQLKYTRDPALEVDCPVCRARVGKKCRVIRPSEHVHSAAFAGLPPWGHDARDLLACAEGKYRCGCGITAEEARRRYVIVMRGEKLPKPSGAETSDLFKGVWSADDMRIDDQKALNPTPAGKS